MIKKTALRVGLLGALVAAMLVPAGTANATVTGAVVFHCTAHLPAFPAANGTGDCGNDTTPAIGVGVGAGLDNSGAPYAILGPGTFGANFSYQEACLPGLNEPPLLGTANGTATVSGATAVHGGPTTATLSTNFAWTRVGLTAVILTSNTNVAFGNGGSASAAAPGAAVGAFAPLISPTANVCPAGASLRAIVVGALAQPA